MAMAKPHFSRHAEIHDWLFATISDFGRGLHRIAKTDPLTLITAARILRECQNTSAVVGLLLAWLMPDQ